MKLEVVQEAALAQASAEAEALLRAARARTEGMLARARDDAAALVAERRAAAERLADLEERQRIAAARTQARTTVLSAQRSMLLEATASAHANARGLADDPRYRAQLERLAADARARLAGDGPVTLTEAPGGGFVARAGSRQLDYSLDAQLDRCLASMAGELERLWR
jgi:vacuolar-type H+-ATPase subunit E/Vma4